MGPSIPDHYKGLIEASVTSYYDALIGSSIIDHHKGLFETSMQCYYDALLGPTILDHLRVERASIPYYCKG
jgi:hypothetical protein